MEPLLGFTLAAILGILTAFDGSSAEPVFVSEALVSTFGTLRSRQCLPDDFDGSALAPQRIASLDLVKDPDNIPAECANAPISALFYNTYASSLGLLDADATSFDAERLATLRYNFSAEWSWFRSVRDLTRPCREGAVTGLSARQMAVYDFACFKWSLFTECDTQQAERGALDESGLLRRARFLTGSCPTSPDSLKVALKETINQSVEECRQGLYSGDDAQQLYDAGVSLVTCLLKDFIKPSAFVNLAQLRAKTSVGARTADAELLSQVVTDCARAEDTPGRGQFKKMTAEEFAQCWATSGVFTCATQEANRMASDFPTDCAMSLNTD